MTLREEARRALDLLVVDDEAGVRELLVEFFEHQGCRVTAVVDGLAAVQAIERSPSRFTLVVTDLQLPGLDGLGVLRAAKKANPSCYVVLVTGFASLDSAVEAVRHGAYDYLTKPFSLGQLEVVLERVADRLALEAENRQLARRLADLDGGEARHGVQARLDDIDARLARIEAAVLRMTGRSDAA